MITNTVNRVEPTASAARRETQASLRHAPHGGSAAEGRDSNPGPSGYEIDPLDRLDYLELGFKPNSEI